MVQYVNRLASAVPGIHRSFGSGSLDTTVPVACDALGACADAMGAATAEPIVEAQRAAMDMRANDFDWNFTSDDSGSCGGRPRWTLS